MLSACYQEEETPEKLILGKYVLYKSETLTLINDSVAVMYFNVEGLKHYDTLKIEYSPPLKDKEIVSVGDLFLESPINQNSELSKYCRNYNYDETHLYYTIRYGKYMLLPNPESTGFSYVLKE